jgi:multifunctional 2-oxoglutarate metabolism enzyme
MASTTVQITMPQMGESVTEGTVLEWRKQVGDHVEAEETVVDVSTDKIDAEVPAPAEGVISEILVEADQTVPVGTVLAQLAVGAAAGDGGATAGIGKADHDVAPLGDGATVAGNGAASRGAFSRPDDGGGVPVAPDTGESVAEEAEHGASAEAERETATDAAAERESAPGEAVSDRGGATPAATSGELVDVTLPQMGESVSEGTVLEWVKQVGDTVRAGETVVEVSTDKVDAEVPAPADGVMAEILVQPDQVVGVGTVLCRIAVGAGVARAPAKPAAGAAATGHEERAEAPSAAPAAPVDGGDAEATPVARRIASAHGIDVSELAGSGPRGRVRKSDVLAAVEGNGAAAAPAADGLPAGEPTSAAPAPEPTTTEAAPPPSAQPAGSEPGPRPLRGPAATLARFMDESRSIPTATSFRTLSVDTLDARRGQLKAAGRRLSFTHLIAWAIVEAACEMPVMARAYAEQEGNPQVVEPAAINLGLAVDVEKRDGSRFLVTPVLQDAGSYDVAGFVARYDKLVTGARDGTLAPEAYTGANITLTNPGGIGTVASVPRLMPGQGTIVATGAIGYPKGFEHLAPDRLRELGVSKTMTITSTYDHRVIQGAQSGAFLKRIDELLAGADGFYEGIFDVLGAEAPRATAVAATPEAPGEGAGAVTAAEPVPSPVTPEPAEQPDEAMLQAVQAATSVVKAHRMHGHLWARLDPLGSEPEGDPALDPRNVHLTPELMRAIPASVLRVAVPGETFGEALPRLQETYCGTIAYEFEHISDHDQRVWLRQTVESGEHRRELPPEEKRRLLDRLTQVEALENYLHKAFLGRKQFSIEGLDALVPMLDETIELAAAAGAREVVIGMAHRGRLNVLTHNIGRPYESILVEFEGEQTLDAETAMPEGGTGDVKYHHGASGTYRTQDGRGITVTLSPNPSHLEYVDPVVEGRARADQSSRKTRELHHDPTLVLPVLVHGDAAFPAQGVVAETLNLQGLRGYTTGGTLHLITNNQLGFTTEPSEARSTRYASDLAKGFDIPIIHVNADDVEACVAAVRLAMAYRERFRKDALIDLVGYRRFGHNETDEPAYTQPRMYARIKEHPPVRSLYADLLADEGVVTDEEVEELKQAAQHNLAEAHDELKEAMAREDDTGEFELDRGPSTEPRTALGEDALRSLNEQLLKVPEGFEVHRKLKPQLERRRQALGPEGGIDWAQAEGLAFASLLCQGVPVRLTGQDTERGTFSQRHLVFHDAKTGEEHTPIMRLPKSSAPFELYNSPLSEMGCLGFEYGYSAQAPEALVVWEAQFGDFVNAAQVIVDQFIVSGLAKWGQTTRLTLLLPHGYEGSGPEHSSARLERFMNLGAEGNIRVAYSTTPAQYFHLLRRQALVAKQRPLVVMTPKSLLRHPEAISHLDELANGSFQAVLDDPTLPGEREEIRQLVLCSGKLYYDLAGHPARAEATDVAIGRVELLYPFAENELRELIRSYPSLETVVWAQEEPKNMGARTVMEQRLAWILTDEGIGYAYVGRPLRASPGEGYPPAHKAEQSRILREALRVGEESPRDASGRGGAAATSGNGAPSPDGAGSPREPDGAGSPNAPAEAGATREES